MVKRFLSLVCCLAMCTPVVAMAQSSETSNTMVVSADSYNMKTSQKAVDLIKSCEGFSSKAYWDYKQWTIGYGTYVESDTTYPNGITEAQGEQMLYKALETFEDYVNSFLKRNNVTVNQNQFDALICFTYAIPSWSFKGNEDYTISQMLINGVENYSDQEVYDIFGLYVKAGTGENKVTLPGLVRRRTMEASLFLYGNTTTEVPLDANLNTTNTVTQTSNNDVPSVDVSTQDVDTTQDVHTTWIVDEPEGIKLRHSYGLSSNQLSGIPDGATIVVEETKQADGYTWGKTTYNGITGWCALDYCKQIENVAPQFDVNEDGQFTLTDLGILKSYVLYGDTLTDKQLKLADVDGDGKVTYADYKKAMNLFLLEP